MLQNCRKLNSVGRAARNARSMKPRKYSQTILIIQSRKQGKVSKQWKGICYSIQLCSLGTMTIHFFFNLLICLLFIWLQQVLAAACGTWFPDQRFSPCPLNGRVEFLATGPPVRSVPVFQKVHLCCLPSTTYRFSMYKGLNMKNKILAAWGKNSEIAYNLWERKEAS